jgi:DNA invertase Pin-like site-specific DNA recombinase
MKSRTRIRGSTGPKPPSRPVGSAVGFLSGPPNGGAPERLRSQEALLDSSCRSLGLRLVELIREETSDNGGSAERPELERALNQLQAGEVSCLMVQELEQLSRNVDELASVIDRLERAGARLVALDVGLDTASSSGRLALERRPVAGQSVYAAEPAVLPPAEPPASEAASGVVVTNALGYTTLPGKTGHDERAFDAAIKAIGRRCTDLGLDLIDVVHEGQVEGKALDRPGLAALIERIAAGEAGCLVVGTLGQLSHSVAELGALVNWLERNQVRLITVELELDTASSGGRLTARALSSVAGFQHDRLSERTRKGLAAAQSRRRAAAEETGPGRHTAGWPEISQRIAAMRRSGMTLQAIADVLNAEDVPTPRGGAEWRPSSVQTAAGYKRRSRAKKADELPAIQPPPSDPSG